MKEQCHWSFQCLSSLGVDNESTSLKKKNLTGKPARLVFSLTVAFKFSDILVFTAR